MFAPIRSLVIALLLSACAAPCACPRSEQAPAALAQHTPVWVDARFPAREREAVEHALERWNVALGGRRVFFLATDELDDPRGWLGAVPWGVTISYNDPSPDDVPSLFLAQVLRDNDVQFYGDHFDGQSYEWIALHELGHVLGLADNERGAHLMGSPITSSISCIDRGTLQRIADRRPTWRPSLRAECE